MRLTGPRPDAPPTSIDLLAARARRGDRRATAALRRRMTPRVHQLAVALAVDERHAPAVVRLALADALQDTERAYGSAVVAAVQRRAGRNRPGAAAVEAGPDRLKRAVGVLCDVQGHSHSSAAALLGQPVAEVAALHGASRADAGVGGPREHCRGWHLVARPGLTPPEQTAANRHLEICRSCREALEARAVARRRLKAALPVGGTALGGVAAALSALGGGSVAAGTVAAGTAAVLGAGSLVAAVPPAAMTDAPRTPVSVSATTPEPTPSPTPSLAPATTAPADAGQPAPPSSPTGDSVAPPQDGADVAPPPDAPPPSAPPPSSPPPVTLPAPLPDVPLPVPDLPLPLPDTPLTTPAPLPLPPLLEDPTSVLDPITGTLSGG